jgi:di/tricarboxylate transporter
MPQGKSMNRLTDFAKGVIVGALFAIIVFGIIAGLTYLKKRDKELIKYAEKQIEIENLREDINNRSADEFLKIPDVRRATDGARDEFDRKRNEILERYRSQYAD